MPGFSVDAIAPQDETKTRTLSILGHDSEVTYYPNRMTLEGQADYTEEPTDGDDDTPLADDEQYRVAANTCRLIHAWDWEGPVKRADGVEVVGRGEPVPIDPEIVRCIPTRILRSLNQEIARLEFPDPNRKARRAAAKSSRR